MVLAGRSKLKSFPKLFSGGHLVVFVEYLCNRSPKIKTKNIKKYSSNLAIVNHWNWLDDSPPLKYTKCHISTNLSNFLKLCLLYCKKLFALAPINRRFAEKNWFSGNTSLKYFSQIPLLCEKTIYLVYLYQFVTSHQHKFAKIFH